MASESAWASFFSGPYIGIEDGTPIGTGSMSFSVKGPLRLGVEIAVGSHITTGGAELDMKTGFIKGGFGEAFFRLACFELVADPGGAFVVGFNPSGEAYIRWEGSIDAHFGKHPLQFNSANRKFRPDKNYPWNLPPYGPG
jgi:hypothetical protein